MQVSAYMVEIIALVLLPLAVFIVAYSLVVFIWRNSQIAMKQASYIDDRRCAGLHYASLRGGGWDLQSCCRRNRWGHALHAPHAPCCMPKEGRAGLRAAASRKSVLLVAPVAPFPCCLPAGARCCWLGWL